MEERVVVIADGMPVLAANAPFSVNAYGFSLVAFFLSFGGCPVVCSHRHLLSKRKRFSSFTSMIPAMDYPS